MLLFIGIQASGKTTFYLQHFFDTHVRVSLDLLRTRHRFVIDNTNATLEERARYISQARKAKCRVVGYFFEPDPKASFERNQQRGKKHYVPPAGLFGTLKRLERPRVDEGYDALFRVRAFNGLFEVEPMD